MIELRDITDIDSLMKWRREVILNVFGMAATDTLLNANHDYYLRHIPDGSHKAVVASTDGGEVGTGAICLSEELPSPDNPTGKCAYLMNIYVRKQYRNKGIARRIIDHLVDVAKQLGCGKIYLESTDMAKPLYSGLGFTNMENMMKYEI